MHPLKLVEQGLFFLVGDGHFGGGDLFSGGFGEAQFADGKALFPGRLRVGVNFSFRGGIHLDGRAEDAAGHWASRVKVAEAGFWIERGTGSLVGEIFEGGLIVLACAEDAGLAVTWKDGAEFSEIAVCAPSDDGGPLGLVDGHFMHCVT